MDTLHKLAGVRDASDTNEQPSYPVPKPPPIPADSDGENDSPHVSHRSSRVSLPLNRQPSHKSFRSSKHNSQGVIKDNASPRLAPADYPPVPSPNGQSDRGRTSQDSGVSENDFEWGPSHPCFPHPNPHCAQDSEEFKTTRVIRVRRDWLQAGDLYPQYANLYPEILDPLVTEEDFRFLISTINARLKTTFYPYTTRAMLDSFLGVATGFIWDDLGFTGSKKGMKSLESFVDKWNSQKRHEGKEVKLVQLRRTGFMALDFVVPDPGIEAAHGEDLRSEGGIGPAE